MSNYTKGEWDAQSSDVWCGGLLIAELAPETFGDNSSLAPVEEMAANAKLIAAAPDLLKAVELAMRIIKVAESFDKNIGGWKDFKPLAEKALAKAKA